MPRKSAATPRSRKKSASANQNSPEPSKPSGTRKTPSRACKNITKFPVENPVRKVRSKIPTPIAERPASKNTPKEVPRSRLVLDEPCDTAPVPAAGLFQKLNNSGRAQNDTHIEPATVAPVGLIQDQSGFSDDDDTPEQTIGIGDFRFQSSPKRKFSFQPSPELENPAPNKSPLFKFEFKPPTVPAPASQLNASVTESLLSLRQGSDIGNQSLLSVSTQEAPPPADGPAKIHVGRSPGTSPLPKTPQLEATDSVTVSAPQQRPPYKNRLASLLRNRIGFKKGDPEIRTTEDAGKSASEDATALHFKKTNQLYVNVPFKARLLGVADTLGIGVLSMALHCAIFMLSFWFCNLLYTYWFPATEDERVNYFYEMLTRQQVGSFYVHFKHYARWFTWPRCQPEFLALLCTITASASIARLLRLPEDHTNTRKIKLVKLC